MVTRHTFGYVRVLGSVLNLYATVNRRMDEWVSLSRIDVKRGPVEEGPKEVDYMLDSLNGRERKVTRNLKRKHDEINHVQKVKSCLSFSLPPPLSLCVSLSLTFPKLILLSSFYLTLSGSFKKGILMIPYTEL